MRRKVEHVIEVVVHERRVLHELSEVHVFPLEGEMLFGAVAIGNRSPQSSLAIEGVAVGVLEKTAV